MSNKNKKISIIKFSLLHSINRTISFIRSNLFVILFSAITLGIIIIHIPLCKSLKFIDDQNISIILSVIIGALSSILGIVVAIQLVAFEILRRTFYSFAFKEFFNSNQSKYLFERLILTICVSSISLFILTRPISDRNYLLTYLSFSLFIYCLLILFPATKRMIILSRSREKIIEIISKIDSRAISDFNYFRPGVPTNEQMDIIENNPFFIISDVCVRSINEEDCITPRFILIKANSKLLFLLKHCDKGQEAREIINTFFMIYISAFNKAVSLNQIGTIHSILSIIEEIQHHCAKNNFAWYSMIEMNENFENILFKLIENNNIELTKRGIWILERAYIKHLIENTAPEDEIWILNDLTNTSTEKVEHDKSNQWTTISSDLLYKLSNVIERAISLQKFEI
ncbi:MAG: hypothetical protein HOD37_04240, partial [Bacteroidetes bacterium]|nr:hypothetical protein [Bacteroidota bacterium]